MKKITTLFASMMLFAGLTTAFTSCSDDDNNEPEIPAAKSVAGTYTGDMSCTVMGSESTFEDMVRSRRSATRLCRCPRSTSRA